MDLELLLFYFLIEIVNLNYYMKVKENEDNINSWTFDELKKCVADFNELL